MSSTAIVENKSSLTISFINGQGVHLSATVLRLKRYSVVFEVYNPYSILQTSEVLSDFQIISDNRVLYSGRATVSNLVNTGGVIVCEVTLGESWLDVRVSSGSVSTDMPKQLEEYLNEWDLANEVIAPMKLVAFETEKLFTGLRQWLEKVDLGIRSVRASERQELEHEVFRSLEPMIAERFHKLVLDFCQAADQVPAAEVANHKAFIRRQLHPIIMCAPFLYRTYTKPLGYAGDFEMVNMILKQEFSGSSAFAKLINYTFLKSPPAEAHRNRINILEDKIHAMAEQAIRQNRKLRIFNLGCGPAEEIFRVMNDEDVSDVIEVTLLDFNDDTLKQTKERLDQKRMEAGRDTKITYIQKSVNQVIKEASKGEVSGEKYDLVYCAGLFDYLSQKVCSRLVSLFHSMISDEGEVLVTNVSSDNPVSKWMEYVMDWNLIYRTDEQMLNLTDGITTPVESKIFRDTTGVNVFLEVKSTVNE